MNTSAANILPASKLERPFERAGVGCHINVPTPKSGSAKASFDYWYNLVQEQGLSMLSGNSLTPSVIKEWKKWLPLAVEQGLISQDDADYVMTGITEGFALDVDHAKLKGTRYHKNYKSALEQAPLITDALRKRVRSGKTLKLGTWKAGE